MLNFIIKNRIWSQNSVSQDMSSSAVRTLQAKYTDGEALSMVREDSSQSIVLYMKEKISASAHTARLQLAMHWKVWLKNTQKFTTVPQVASVVSSSRNIRSSWKFQIILYSDLWISCKKTS